MPHDRVKHHASQLNDKQRHAGFDYYEYDMPNLVPPVEPKVCSTEVLLALTSKNTLRILNLKTIKPVTRPFTAMVAAKLVIATWKVLIKSGISQVARSYKL